MQQLQAVSVLQHQNKSWVRPDHYHFAKKDVVALVGWHEIPQVMMQYSLALMQHEGSYYLVVILGFNSGENLAVSNQGQWVMEYMPAVYRCYPFRVSKNTEGNYVLCVDNSSGLIREDGLGNSFIGENKQLTGDLQKMAETLVQLENERKSVATLCSTLERLGLIEQWKLQVKDANGQVRQLNGLFRISESKLMALTAAELTGLRDAGGLTLCYSQLFSMQNIHRLAKLAAMHEMDKVQLTKAVPTLAVRDNGGVISFDNL
jgi:hypothetical protein